MPSAFEQILATNLPTGMYGPFGLPAVYTAPDGTATAGLTVRVHRNDVRETAENRKVGETQTGEIMVLQSALSNPVKGGRFVVEGVEVWTVANTPTLKNQQFTCTCDRTGVERVMQRRAKD